MDAGLYPKLHHQTGAGNQAEQAVTYIRELLQQTGDESIAYIRREMRNTLEEGAGIYRDEEGAQKACDSIASLRQRFENIEVHDKSNVFNTDLQSALELRNMSKKFGALDALSDNARLAPSTVSASRSGVPGVTKEEPGRCRPMNSISIWLVLAVP